MSTILQLTTSLYAEEGQSSKLAREFIDAWRQRHPQDRVIFRDLANHPVPHLTAERFRAFTTPRDQRTPRQRAIAAYSDALIEELRQADVIVIGLPMYNFSVPSTLKAYFDHVARAGHTFRYTADGFEGLLKGKTAYIFATRGGKYAGTQLDTQSDYVRDFLRFLGIVDVEFIYAEGLDIDVKTRRLALASAQAAIRRLNAINPAA